MKRWLHRFPNLEETYGTSLPVVMALFGSISAAFLVVPLVDSAKQESMGFLPWTENQITTVTGSLATTAFSGAAICALYAQAARYGKATGGSTNPAYDYYKCAQRFFVNGLSLLSLTIGTLALRQVKAEIPVMAAIALILALGGLSDDIREWWSWPACILLCGAIVTISYAAYY
ncbi:hypothetical protein [Kitasatospora sp. NPDC058190]|uniref:hypothetical protein n=1 Tax=Kitasatospora sp. NPDC058190 TaxID=3346371 RepID=UPI0036DC3674